ncbi:MAG: hypothetical protein NTV97_34000 [Alphaproteobacteria bacterium]|nr:hypothetical protein [Alphaproteobacteria bacterium]
MPKLSWSKMMARHPDAHLVIAIADDGQDAARLLARLFEGMALSGGWALRATKEGKVEFAECVFAEKAAAAKVARLFGAAGIGRYPGWKSQREFRLDKRAEAMILQALEQLA